MAAPAQRGIVLRLSTEGTEQVKAALKSLGAEGEQALRQLERGAQRVTPQLTALDAAAKRIRNSISGEFQKLASGIVGMISPVNLLIGAFGTLVGAAVGWLTSAVSGTHDTEAATEALTASVERLRDIYGDAADAQKELTDAERNRMLLQARTGLFEREPDLTRALQNFRAVYNAWYLNVVRTAPALGEVQTALVDFLRSIDDGTADVAAFVERLEAIGAATQDAGTLSAVNTILDLNEFKDIPEIAAEVERYVALIAFLTGNTDESVRATLGLRSATDELTASINEELKAHEQLVRARGQSTEASREEAEVQEFLIRQSMERISALLAEEAMRAGEAINAIFAVAFGDPALAEAAQALEAPVVAVVASIRDGTPDVLAFRAAVATFANLDPENEGIQAFADRLLAITKLAADLQAGLSPAERPAPPSGDGGGAAATAAAAEHRRLEQLARTVLQEVNPALAAEIELQERLSDLAAIRAAELLSEADYAAAVAAAHRDYAVALEEARLAQEGLDSSLRAGGIRALHSLADEALDAGGVIEQALTSAFRAAESAFDDFLEGGEDSFRKFVEAILKDLARLAFQQGLAMLAQGVFGALTAGGAGGFFANLLTAMVSHEGGRVGEPMPTRQVSPALFLGAPRLHTGLAPDEFPAILQRGETVLPKGAGPVVNVRINNNAPGVSHRVRANSTGPSVIELVIDAIANDIASGGRTAGAIGRASRDGLIR